MDRDMTAGNITSGLLKFAFPLMAGNVLQQFYNLADTFIVGRVLGPDALAAVGSSYTLMTFLTSIIIGLCMGSSAYFAMQYGKKDYQHLRQGIFLSFLLIFLFTLTLNLCAFLSLHWIIGILQIPSELQKMTADYLLCIFAGIFATFLYNFFANLMRAVGNSLIPLIFLGISVILNILLDILFVMAFRWDIRGAAIATVISQFASGIGIACYCHFFCPMLCVHREHMRWNGRILKEIFSLSFLTCLQQSVMNFGILMIQGLVNSFGTTIMAAFAAAVKIDTLAYMPVQDFGNAFSTFTAQNYGAGKTDRIRKGIRSSILCILAFCTAVSLAVCLFAQDLMGVFIDQENTQVIQVGVRYLRIEAAFYFGIGILFMLYGYYRAIEKPGMSVLLTLCSLGTRVALAYLLSDIPTLGVSGIWISIPIGWILADMAGISYYLVAKVKSR
ncbi:MAG: MATE family efflux transporter [Lachnospiraceae bacterium]|nr:MATE family efflux transporter [Lachnospiraceae bacterium]